MENILTLGKLLRLWFCFILGLLYLKPLIVHTNNFSYELARPIMGTIFLVSITVVLLLASERSERDTLRSVQLRIVYYIYIIVRAIFVLITRKEGGA